MKTKITASLISLVVSLLAPLGILVPQASAAADTCTWVGLGTGVEDSTAKTWTYDVSDTANWNGCDNGNLPEAGDTLTFPTNLADVDPLDANTDDADWKYVVNNDLTADTNIAGVNFTGDTGSDCNIIDDKYIIAGNSISLSGDVSSAVTGSCANYYGHIPVLDISITTSADVSVSVGLEDAVAPFTENTLTFGANALSFCDVLDADRNNKNPYINSRITGTGILTIACSVSWYPTAIDTFGDVVVESNTSFSAGVAVMGASATKTYTFKSGATFNIYESLGKAEEFKSNIVFVGAGSTMNYCKSVACLGSDYVEVTGYRGSVSNNTYDSVAKKYTYYGVNFTGDITLSEDTVFSNSTDMTISGAVSGAFKVNSVPGSRGKILMQSSDNQSATPNGTIESARFDYALTDNGFDLYLSYGYNAILKTTDEITHKVWVRDGAILKGTGKVAGLEVRTGGILAPGLSPGCINSTSGLTLAGAYQVEIAGKTVCTEYDQTDVTGTVTLTGGTLSTTFLNSYVPALNDTFTIIKNDAADAVTGTFTGLAQGATFAVNGVTFQISYTGGDGNDVVLTATAVPTAVTTPETGIGSIISNPLITLISAMFVAGTLIGLRKLNNQNN